MTTSKIQVTEGSGKNISTYSFSEDAATKEVQRFAPNTSAGVEVTLQLTSVGVVTLQSNATGTTYNAFSSQACIQATLVNDTGVDLEIQLGGSGSTFILWANTALTIPGISNMSTIGYRRKDTSNTQVTLAAFWNS